MTDLSQLMSELVKTLNPGILHLLKPVSIVGVEVTQAIQYCRASEHLTDPNDRGADNSLTLVADKPAVVRVYVHGRFADEPNVRGTVTVQRRRLGVWVDTGTLTQAAPAALTAFSDAPYASERGQLRGSLNFMVPGEAMIGEMRLVVHVEQVGRPDHSDDESVVVHASLRQTFKLRGIPVRYWGPDASGTQVRLDAPTVADFTTECAWACTTWPVSPRPEVSLAGTFTWSNPLTGNMANGSCPTSWIDLLYWLRVARTLDGDQPDRFYYALLPRGVPTGDTGGCGNPGGVGAGFVGGNGGTTIAHELGHVLGFSHVFGNLPSDDNTWDRSYPVYEPYDSTAARTGTIGEYGFDLTTSTVMSPTWSTDFMGYGANPWISPYHHRLMIEHPRLSPVWVPLPRGTLAPLDDEQVLTWPPVFPGPPEPPWGEWTERVRSPERESLFVVSGRRVGGEVQMQHVLHLEAFIGSQGRAVPGLTVELLGSNREVLSQALVHLLPTRACGEGCDDGCGGCEGGSDADADLILQAKVRDPGDDVNGTVSAIRVVKLGEEVWSREAPSRPPEVGGVEAGFDGEQLFVRWDADAADDAAQLDRFVRWSGDDGRTWQVLAVGVDADELTISPAAMTSGPALVQVMVSDGFHTVTSEPVRVDVPWRAPEVAILWPRSSAAITASNPLRLWGVATASTGEALDGERVTWEVDGERVAVGPDQFAWLSLSPGEHRAVMRADDTQGEGSAEVVFTVRDPSD